MSRRSRPEPIYAASQLRPDFYRTYAALEWRIGQTLSPTRRPLPEVTGVRLAAGADFEDLTAPIGA